MRLEQLTASVLVNDVIKAAKINRDKHSKIVEEARAGYLKKAQAAIEQRLADLKKGKIVSLHFSLSLPVDHTKEYDKAIALLEMHQGNTIELSSDQLRCLMHDEWEWQRMFLMSNSAYSNTAAVALGNPSAPDEFE